MSRPSAREADQARALAPVRAELLRTAHAEAGEVVGHARREAAALLAAARRDAADAVAKGRADGRQQAGRLAAARLSRGRREAGERLLRARRAAYEQLRRDVREGVAALPGEPGYERLAERLATAALAAAGPGATLIRHPDGGVVATAPGVIVDCSLPLLADQAVQAVSADLDTLWPQRTDRGAGAAPAGPRRAQAG